MIMAMTKAEFDAAADAWLKAQVGYRQHLKATENLFAAFAEGWRGPRRAIDEAFDSFRAGLLRDSGCTLLEVREVVPTGHPERQ
jgi:hypothetical protein